MARKRKSGEGTLRLRKDGRWEGRIVIGYDEKGLPKTKNVLAKTKRECQDKLKQLKQACDATGARPQEVDPSMTFGAWIDFWYQNYCKQTVRETTQQYYETKIYLHIIPELGGISLKDLTQNDMQQFYTRLKQSGRLTHTELYGEGLSDQMVRGCHASCRAALEKAAEMGLIRKNPAVGCKLPPKKAREMQLLTREEMQRLLIQAQEESCYELFLLELATGLRRGEIAALQWDDLDFEKRELHISRQVYRVNGKLTVTEPKTKTSIRTVVLPPAVVEVLWDYRQRYDSRWIFPSPVKEDSPRDPASLRKRLHLILEHAGCKQVRFHDLRHLFSTNALAGGMDVKTLAAVLGHQSVATTLDIYSHVTDGMRQEAAAKIDRGIMKADAPELRQGEEQVHTMTDFQPYKGKKRKPGTSCVSQINDHLWEGRYSPVWPDGKKHARNVYAHSEEECEAKLAELIVQMKAEIAEAKAAQEVGCKTKKKTPQESARAEV